jgi:hypothetical protein
VFTTRQLYAWPKQNKEDNDEQSGKLKQGRDPIGTRTKELLVRFVKSAVHFSKKLVGLCFDHLPICCDSKKPFIEEAAKQN